MFAAKSVLRNRFLLGSSFSLACLVIFCLGLSWPAGAVIPTPTPGPAGQHFFGTIWDESNDDAHSGVPTDSAALGREYAAGIRLKNVYLRWSLYEPVRGNTANAYITQKIEEVRALRAQGFTLVLRINPFPVPTWYFTQFPNSRYKNQFGVEWRPEDYNQGPDGAVSLWAPEYKTEFERYIRRVFADLGNNFYAVYATVGQYGEVAYPVHTYDPDRPGDSATYKEDFQGHTNCYWAYDKYALTACPTAVRGWKPGDVNTGEQTLAGERLANGGFEDFTVQGTPTYYKNLGTIPNWGSSRDCLNAPGWNPTVQAAGVTEGAQYLRYDSPSGANYYLRHETSLRPSGSYALGAWVRGDGSWSGMGSSFNVNANRDATQPSLAVANNVPYAAWAETNGSRTQVYVKTFTGSAWVSLGGSLNSNPNQNAADPSLTLLQTTPYVAYVAWRENNGSADQILVKHWTGSTWAADGGSLNMSAAQNAMQPSLGLVNGAPYVVWKETQGGVWRLFVKHWTGSAWAANGGSLNIAAARNADTPQLVVNNNTPYVIWSEVNASGNYQIYVKHWDGSAWVADGGSMNVSTARTARYPRLTFMPGVPYAVWDEKDASGKYQLYVKKFTAGAWTQVGGNLNRVTTQDAVYPDIAAVQGKVYVAWEGFAPGVSTHQILLSHFEGSQWTADRGSFNSLASQNAYAPALAAGTWPCLIWREVTGSVSRLYGKSYSATTTGFARVTELDASGQTVGSALLSGSDSVWTRLAQTLTPASGAVKAQVDLYLTTSTGGAGRADFDGVSLVDTARLSQSHAKAQQFLDWYNSSLAGFMNWQQGLLKQLFNGKLIIMEGGFASRSGDVEAEVRNDLNGSSTNNYWVRRGFSPDRYLAALTDRNNVYFANTAVEQTGRGDGAAWNASPLQSDWSAPYYMAYLANANGLGKWSENSGKNNSTQMTAAFDNLVSSQYLGLGWYTAGQLLDTSHGWASLADFQANVARVGGGTEPEGFRESFTGPAGQVPPGWTATGASLQCVNVSGSWLGRMQINAGGQVVSPHLRFLNTREYFNTLELQLTAVSGSLRAGLQDKQGRTYWAFDALAAPGTYRRQIPAFSSDLGPVDLSDFTLVFQGASGNAASADCKFLQIVKTNESPLGYLEHFYGDAGQVPAGWKDVYNATMRDNGASQGVVRLSGPDTYGDVVSPVIRNLDTSTYTTLEVKLDSLTPSPGSVTLQLVHVNVDGSEGTSADMFNTLRAPGVYRFTLADAPGVDLSSFLIKIWIAGAPAAAATFDYIRIIPTPPPATGFAEEFSTAAGATPYGWRDSTNSAENNSTLVGTGQGVATVNLLGAQTYGDVLSPVIYNLASPMTLALEFKITRITPGAYLDAGLQEVAGTNRYFGGYGRADQPGVYRVRLSSFASTANWKAVTLKFWINGTAGSSSLDLDYVRLVPVVPVATVTPTADGYLEHFAGPAGVLPAGWRDRTTFEEYNATLKGNGASGAVIGVRNQANYGDVISPVITGLDVSQFGLLEIKVDGLANNASLDIGLQEENGAYRYFPAFTGVNTPGIYRVDVNSIKQDANLSAFSLKFWINGTQNLGQATLDYVRLVRPQGYAETFTTPYIGTPLGWRDATNSTESNGAISNLGNSTAAISLLGGGGFGDVLSPAFHHLDPAVYNYLELNLTSLNAGTYFDVGLQEETGQHRFFGALAHLAAPGVYGVDINSIKQDADLSAYSLKFWINGTPGVARGNLAYVRVYPATPTLTPTPTATFTATATPTASPTPTPGYVENFMEAAGTVPTGWRDASNSGEYNANLRADGGTTATLSLLSGNTYGDVLSPVIDNLDTNTYNALEIRITGLGANAYLDAGLQEETGARRYYGAFSHLDAAGTHRVMLSAVRSDADLSHFSLKLWINGTAGTSSVVLDYVRLVHVPDAGYLDHFAGPAGQTPDDWQIDTNTTWKYAGNSQVEMKVPGGGNGLAFSPHFQHFNRQQYAVFEIKVDQLNSIYALPVAILADGARKNLWITSPGVYTARIDDLAGNLTDSNVQIKVELLLNAGNGSALIDYVRLLDTGSTPTVTPTNSASPTVSPTVTVTPTPYGAWVSDGGSLNQDVNSHAVNANIASANGQAYVAWEENGNIYVKTWDGSAWQGLGGSVNGQTGGFGPKLCFVNGTLFLAYNQVVGSNFALAFRSWNGNAWTVLPSPLYADNMYVPMQYALAAYGNQLTVAYTIAGSVVYSSTWNGSTWNPLNQVPFFTATVFSPDLSVDPVTGHLYMVYEQKDSSAPLGHITYVTWDAASNHWTTEGVSSIVHDSGAEARTPRIAVYNGVKTVAWVEGGNLYLKDISGTDALMNLDASATAANPDLDVTAAGVFLVWQENGRLHAGRRTGGVFQLLGGVINLDPANYANAPSLTLNNGQPGLAWNENNGHEQIRVKHFVAPVPATATPTLTPTPSPSPSASATPTASSTPPALPDNAWLEEFTGTAGTLPAGWQDERSQSAFNAFVTYATQASTAAVTKTAEDTWGKVLSPGIGCDVSVYTQVEISVLSVQPATAWKVGIQEINGGWSYWDLGSSTSSAGTFAFSIPAATGWSGTHTFSVQVTVEGGDGKGIVVDWVRVCRTGTVYGASVKGGSKALSIAVSPSFTPTASPTVSATTTPTPAATQTPTATFTATPWMPEHAVTAFPNPARGRVQFAYSVRGAALVKIDIYRLTGERVAHIEERRDGGEGQTFTTAWEAAGVAPGIYFCRIVITDAAGAEVVNVKKKVALIH